MEGGWKSESTYVTDAYRHEGIGAGKWPVVMTSVYLGSLQRDGAHPYLCAVL